MCAYFYERAKVNLTVLSNFNKYIDIYINVLSIYNIHLSDISQEPLMIT